MVMGEFSQESDLAILGGGPGGYAAAFRAADLGLNVTLIDKDGRAGGVCLFRGCIPSKALLHATQLIYEARRSSQMGIKFAEPEIDLEALRKWKNRTIEKLAGGLANLCEKRGIEIVQARAAFEDSRTLRLFETESEVSRIKFRHCIIATGSAAIHLPDLEFKKDGRLMDSTTALDLTDIPAKLLVVGGGYVGAEIGSIYAILGSQVTLVEMTDGLMPGADRDLVKPLHNVLEDLFAGIYLNTKVEKLEEHQDRVDVMLNGEAEDSEQSFDRVLVAIGRRPNSDNLGLDNTEVELDDKGHIVVDERQHTRDKQIYAIGDVAGGVMLAHKAMYEGRVAAEVIKEQPAASDARAIPAVVYTNPQLAWCGLTETEAKKQNRPVKVTRFPWSASGRAATMGGVRGLTKMIVDPENGQILGLGIVGAEAGELISEGVLAVEMGALAQDVALSIHPHPTLSESEEEAAEAFLGSATHILAK
ncbi:MAG: dihydrolipoyl dehydrogenase [Deltaproteobacteria bacterium]|jgi:dihydrolipoamide dehydrogenase